MAKNAAGQTRPPGAPLRRREREAPFYGDAGEGGQARHGAKVSWGVEGGGGAGDQRSIQEACADPPPRQGGQPGTGGQEYSEQRMKEINAAYAELNASGTTRPQRVRERGEEDCVS